MKPVNLIYLLGCLLSLTACSMNHYIAKDYPQYLQNNVGQSHLGKTNKAKEYYLDPKTQNYKYEFRSVMTGYANLWIVEFGKILDDTMSSADVQSAFNGIKKVSGQNPLASGLLVFNLNKYTFSHFGAHINLTISLLKHGKKVFSKTYDKNGVSQGGKMFWAGAFGQKNAVQQSTKLALDSILRQLIVDLNSDSEIRKAS